MSTRSPKGAHAHADLFGSTDQAPVAGGMITFARAGPPPDRSDEVVLAIHGITGNLMAWRAVARALSANPRLMVLAPDLRGRADSATLPGPYGIAAHVADMVALMDHVGVERVVIVGHSIGAYVAARLAAEHPERAVALALVDGGVPVRDLTDEAAATVRAVVIRPAVARHALTFTSVRAYLGFWRVHPAFADAWNADVEAYVLHDLAGRNGALKYVINVDAIESDSHEMLGDRVSRTALEGVRAPVHLLRATRGALDDDNPMIPESALEAFIAKHPEASVHQIQDVNHYTMLLGNSSGPGHVAAAIEAAVRGKNARGL